MTSKVRDFWTGMPSHLRGSLMVLFGSLATIAAVKAKEMTQPKEEYWDEASITITVQKAVDKAIDKRMGKFEAGWDAFVSKSPKDTQLAVFRAQREYEKNHKAE